VDPITVALQAIHDEVAGVDSGSVAEYIPQLARADPTRFGLAVVSLAGRVYRVGDADEPFTIQSVSKPFVYALALAEHGLEHVLTQVGAEPSGEAFNAISLDDVTGRPANPMINAGAIVTSTLVGGTDARDRFARIHAGLSAFAGRRLEVDEATFESEHATGDRNRALGYLMRSAGSLTELVDEAVETYFRQCALLVTTVDLAIMAATLANAGVNPCTGQRVIGDREAGQVLIAMATCGMYDYSGEWLMRAGLPAKSGVSGALIAVSPAQFGIGVYSPRLDGRGNSVRSVAAVLRMHDVFELDLTRHPGLTSPVVSRREDGPTVAVRGLQGELDFAAAEVALHELVEVRETAARGLVLDLHAVTRSWPVATRLLAAAVADLVAAGLAVAVVGGPEPHLPAVRRFEHLPAAVDWCEDVLRTR
jgi:glutaminase